MTSRKRRCRRRPPVIIAATCADDVACLAAGETARLFIKPCRGVLKERGKCEGVVYDALGKEVGSWGWCLCENDGKPFPTRPGTVP